MSFPHTSIVPFGANVLASRRVTAFAVLGRQLRNPLLILLLGAAAVSAATGDTTDGVARPGRYGFRTPPEAEVARISPADLPGYRRFLVDTEQIYLRAFEQLGRRPFLSWRDIARVAPELVRLGAHRDVYSFVSGYVRDPRLRCILSFVGWHLL